MECVNHQTFRQRITFQHADAFGTLRTGSGNRNRQRRVSCIGLHLAMELQVDVKRYMFQLVTAMVSNIIQIEHVRAVADQSPMNQLQVFGKCNVLRRRDLSKCRFFSPKDK